MSESCAERWRLWAEVEKKQHVARLSGYVCEEDYKPFELAMKDYQQHFKTCSACRTWADEFAEGAKNEIRV